MPLMNPISAAEMTALRSEVATASLDLDCTIKRPAKTSDAWGTNAEPTLNTVTSTKAGMKSPTPATLETYASRIGAKLAWEINFTYGTDVQEQDSLFIGSDKMIVQAILSQQSYSTLTTVLATETV